MPLKVDPLKIPFLWDISQFIFGCDGWKRKAYRAAFNDPGRLLDFGCADGNTFTAFRDFDYYGIDTDKRLIEYAQRRYTGLSNAHFICADILQRPFGPGFFDFILFACTGHHLDDETLTRILRALLDTVKVDGVIHFFDTLKGKADDPLVLRLKFRADRGRYFRTQQEYEKIMDSLRDVADRQQIKILKAHGRFTPQPDYFYARLTKKERSL